MSSWVEFNRSLIYPPPESAIHSPWRDRISSVEAWYLRLDIKGEELPYIWTFATEKEAQEQYNKLKKQLITESVGVHTRPPGLKKWLSVCQYCKEQKVIWSCFLIRSIPYEHICNDCITKKRADFIKKQVEE
jgi:hypothetical protein